MAWNVEFDNWTTVAEDIDFGEGPVVLDDGSVAFTEVASCAVSVFDGSASRRIAKVPGAPNGMTLGRDGALYVANNGGIGPDADHNLWFADEQIDGCVQRVTLDGEVTNVTPDVPGQKPHRANDLCFGPDGRLYFTDSGNWEEYFYAKSDFNSSPSSYRGGFLYVRDDDGTVHELAAVPDFANGLAITPDRSAIIVAQTVVSKLLSYPLNADGSVGSPTVYADLKPHGVKPDGMCFADDGVLYVAGSVGDAIAVVGPGGAVDDVLRLGDHSDPTNLALADGQLWVTTGTGRRLGTIAVDSKPLELFR